MPLRIRVTDTPQKYLGSLDRKTRERVIAKLNAIAEAPLDIRLSKPLVGHGARTCRVGDYRILFELLPGEIVVSDIGPRGQIYRKL